MKIRKNVLHHMYTPIHSHTKKETSHIFISDAYVNEQVKLTLHTQSDVSNIDTQEQLHRHR